MVTLKASDRGAVVRLYNVGFERFNNNFFF